MFVGSTLELTLGMDSKAPKAILPSHTDRFKMIGDSHKHSETFNDNNIPLDYFSRPNLCSLYNRFQNVIPEETEDALCGSPTTDNTEMEDPLLNHPSVKRVLDKIKKLGLTAQTSQNKETFEPYWVETPPNVRGRSNSLDILESVKLSKISNLRRRSSVGFTTELQERFEPFCVESVPKTRDSVENLEPVIPSRRRSSIDFTEELPDPSVIFDPECHTIATKAIGHRRHSIGNIDHTTKSVKNKHERRGSGPGEIIQTPTIPTLKISDISETQKDSDIKRHSSHIVISSIINDVKGELKDQLPNFEGIKSDIFRYDEVLKRSNSAGCLQSIKDKMTILNQNDKVLGKLDDGENENKKGTLSTSMVQETKNTVCSNENRIDKYSSFERDESVDQLIPTFEKSVTIDSCNVKSSNKTMPLREKSIQWVKNKKVRRTQREYNAFSPTSF